MIAADESRSVTTPAEFNSVSPPVEAFKICAPPKATFAASGFPPPNTTFAAWCFVVIQIVILRRKFVDCGSSVCVSGRVVAHFMHIFQLSFETMHRVLINGQPAQTQRSGSLRPALWRARKTEGISQSRGSCRSSVGGQVCPARRGNRMRVEQRGKSCFSCAPVCDLPFARLQFGCLGDSVETLRQSAHERA
jgi:hypothetical protein